MKQLFLVLFVWGAASAQAARPSVYKYLIEALPSQGTSCAAEAERLATEFKRQTGIALATGSCRKDEGTQFDILIEYTAERRVKPLSTVEFIGGAASWTQGSYSSSQACDNDLPGQIDLFKQQTGLEPLVAYCYQESKEPRNAFTLRVEGFGEAKVKPFVYNLELFGYARGDLDAIEAKLKSYTAAKLPALSSIVVRDWAADHAIRVVYYAEKLQPVRSEKMGDYRDAADCERAKGLAEEKLTELKNAPPLLCVNDTILGSYHLELFQVKKGEYLDLVPYRKTYASYPDCESSLDDAMSEVAKSAGSHPVAAACHDASGGKAITVLVSAKRR